jgi:hypothetical protein
MSTPSSSLKEIFDTKYFQFATELKGALPELSEVIGKALGIPSEDRQRIFTEFVLKTVSPTRDTKLCPGLVLPGVRITDELWSQLSAKSKSAIQEYLSLLSFCCMYEGVKNPLEGDGPTREWFDGFSKTWRDKMSEVDFGGLSEKIAELMKNLGPDNLPKMPERLLKGHLAKLVEELVREFKPEDFGLTAEELAACDKDPAGSFKLITDVYSNNPGVLQNAIKRIAKRLQTMIQNGQLRPEQIAAEAEELMKDFSGDGAFADLLKNFHTMFGAKDLNVGRKTGNDGGARAEIVKERLRKKLAEKMKNKAPPKNDMD